MISQFNKKADILAISYEGIGTLRRQMHFKEKDALLGEIRTLRRKMHFKEKDAL